MNTSVNEIRYLVLHDPRPLKFLFKSPTEDKKRLSGIIGRMIPYRIGIEFELFGTLSNLVPKSINSRPGDLRAYIIEKFKLKDYSEDMYNHWSPKKELSGELNEIRISIQGVKQLKSLWNILNALRQNCSIPADKGGIHIHIDFNKHLNSDDSSKVILRTVEYFKRKDVLDRVINIFGGYKGSYNRRGCGYRSKSYWINVSNKNTIEFRIGKLNFDYCTIIRWIVNLSKIVSEAGNELSKLNDKDLDLELTEETISNPNLSNESVSFSSNRIGDTGTYSYHYDDQIRYLIDELNNHYADRDMWGLVP